MKKYLFALFALTVMLATTFLVGCNTPAGQATLERRIERIADLGTDAILVEHPSWTNDFTKAATDLGQLDASTNNVGIEDVLAIMRRLPTLKSANARLYVQGALFILEEAGVPLELNADNSAKVRGIARALRNGILTGIRRNQLGWSPIRQELPLPRETAFLPIHFEPVIQNP